jgi:microcystin-dependent protein
LTGDYPGEGCYSSAGYYNFIGSINLYTKDARFEFDSWKGSGICDRSALNINTYLALYALIGKTYGGNDTTFNKLDLRGAEPDPKLSYYIQLNGIFPAGN